MSGWRPRPGWDWRTDRISEVARRLPPVRLDRHRHTCPDGTAVMVSAQFFSQTGVTLYRWTVGGVRAGVSHAEGPASAPPDWSTVDGDHSITQGSVA